ncbi:hypothetical protein STCU_10631 [Strigomonas culicis]|uniref:Uncharacterized protein n=1 Tax=Strigomonas culicis TaxID=28005 RepID=S9TH64_9TRYP|nr:hypothetical protein STCU_10631 [Strigomonas culicis]|eukprot:EPY17412.1 hypothetical protein STCU_10631 [Strigomonas culicis]
MILHRLRPHYRDEGDVLTFWGRTYCNEAEVCYTVDAVEPKVLIPVLTALCTAALECILLVARCAWRCRSRAAARSISTLSTSSPCSFVDVDTTSKEVNPFAEKSDAAPPHSRSSHSTPLFVIWLFILLLAATQVVALALGIAFYEMEHTKYSNEWRAYGVGFILECLSLAISAFAFFVILINVLFGRDVINKANLYI